MRHHLAMLAITSRYGCWSVCSCKWESGDYTTGTGAHIAFGMHLVEVARMR